MRLFRQRDYVWWFVSDSATSLNVNLVAVALPVMVLTVTGSVTAAGVVGMANSAGVLAAHLPGGVVADRWPRKRVAWIFGSLLAVTSTAVGVLAYTNHVSVAVLAVLSFFAALSSGFLTPAIDSALRELVSKEELPEAVSANQGRDGLLSVIGGPLAGLLLMVNAGVPFVLRAVMGVLAMVSFQQVRRRVDAVREPAEATSAPAGNRSTIGGLLKDLATGFTMMGKSKVLLPLVMIALAINTVGFIAIFTLIVDVKQTYNNDVFSGLVMAVTGVGLLIGASFAPKVVRRFAAGQVIIAGLVGIALCFVGMSLAPDLLTLLVFHGLSFLITPSMTAGLRGYLTAITPSSHQGRVMSSIMFAVSCTAPLAPVVSATLYDSVGRVGVIGGCAVVALLLSIVAAGVQPVRTIPRSTEWDRCPELAV